MPTRHIALIMGTRPEAIKLAPVLTELRRRGGTLKSTLIATAQHREMLDQVLDIFALRPDIDLNVMQPDQSLADLTGRLLTSLDRTLKHLRPDLLIVQGDTTSSFAAALAAFYNKVPVAHVEAGLRSDDKYDPFPEEFNRRVTTLLTELHFAPTPLARRRLLREGLPPEKILVTGNTVVDALHRMAAGTHEQAPHALAQLPLAQHRVLFVTAHRRESWGPPLEEICSALIELVTSFPDVAVVYPVHPNPNVRATVYARLANHNRVYLCEPLNYSAALHLMRLCYLVLTDSGGIQEEAPAFKKPVLVLRRTTERPEACMAGMAKIVGTARGGIIAEATRLLNDPLAYRAMTRGPNPFGDGKAATRIADALERWALGAAPLLRTGDQFCPAA